jgi:hypothetical protein
VEISKLANVKMALHLRRGLRFAPSSRFASLTFEVRTFEVYSVHRFLFPVHRFGFASLTFECSNVQGSLRSRSRFERSGFASLTFECSNVRMFRVRFAHVRMFECSNVRGSLRSRSNVRMFRVRFAHVRGSGFASLTFECSNVQGSLRSRSRFEV